MRVLYINNDGGGFADYVDNGECYHVFGIERVIEAIGGFGC